MMIKINPNVVQQIIKNQKIKREFCKKFGVSFSVAIAIEF